MNVGSGAKIDSNCKRVTCLYGKWQSNNSIKREEKEKKMIL